MISYVLGAPGSGKTRMVPYLRRTLPDWVVLDWDALMEPAGELAGVSIPQAPQTWDAYGRLVKAVANVILPRNLLLLGVCTPQELADWPDGPWLLLDCSDDERRRRLVLRNEPDDVDEAIADAARYRRLGLVMVDSTGVTPAKAARAVADTIIESAAATTLASAVVDGEADAPKT